MSARDEAPDRPSLGAMAGLFLGRVVAVEEVGGIPRVKARFVTVPTGVGDDDAAVWARVAVPFAGSARGSFLIPDVGDEVVVSFVNGDPRQAIVLGGLWNGADRAPETLGGAGDRVDRYAITGRRGTRIAMIEETEGEATISISTPGEVTATLRQARSGEIELRANGHTVLIDAQGVAIETASTVSVTASRVEVNAPQVQVNAASSTFSGTVRCDVLQTTTCIATTYTPGAGNIW